MNHEAAREQAMQHPSNAGHEHQWRYKQRGWRTCVQCNYNKPLAPYTARDFKRDLCAVSTVTGDTNAAYMRLVVAFDAMTDSIAELEQLARDAPLNRDGSAETQAWVARRALLAGGAKKLIVGLKYPLHEMPVGATFWGRNHAATYPVIDAHHFPQHRTDMEFELASLPAEADASSMVVKNLGPVDAKPSEKVSETDRVIDARIDKRLNDLGLRVIDGRLQLIQYEGGVAPRPIDGIQCTAIINAARDE